MLVWEEINWELEWRDDKETLYLMLMFSSTKRNYSNCNWYLFLFSNTTQMHWALIMICALLQAPLKLKLFSKSYSLYIYFVKLTLLKLEAKANRISMYSKCLLRELGHLRLKRSLFSTFTIHIENSQKLCFSF